MNPASSPLPFLDAVGRVSGGGDLSFDEMRAAVNAIMRVGGSTDADRTATSGGGSIADDSITGESITDESITERAITDEQIAVLLTALATKGETVDEVAGAAAALRDHMTPLRTTQTGVVDTCGTGGGGSKTFNVSTTAAIVAAAAGAPVAKHGNRSVTSRSGSADVLAELGVNLQASVEQVERCLDELGICFCFAPLMHPAMKRVGAVRKRLGTRTIFNVLGPLANPARAEHQLLGAGLAELRPLLAGAIHRLGTSRTLVVHGDDGVGGLGVGDVTITGATRVTEVTPDGLRDFEWTPAEFGVAEGRLEDLVIETPAESARLIRQVLAGEHGAPRDMVVVNAAAALIASNRAESPAEAAEQAAAAIDSAAATTLLDKLGKLSHA
ncbi:MAG: anthranilate phosphoribosyltransferase [Planctomycetota bacterium]